MEVIFLGTGASVPTKNRSFPCLAMKREGEIFIFDCGEGAQRQMVLARIGFCRSMKIFVTHLHGDHLFGLPGMLQSMSLLGRKEELAVYGPTGLRDFVDSVNEAIQSTIAFPLEVHEVGRGRVFETPTYEISAVCGSHSVPCLSYVFAEKMKPGRFNVKKAEALGLAEGPLRKKIQSGKRIRLGRRIIKPSDVLGPPRLGVRIVYATDTRPCASVTKAAKNADLLIHDCSFNESCRGKAVEYGHSTAHQAASVAKKSGAKKLILTHIGAECDDVKALLSEARSVFPEVLVAHDLMRLEVA